MDNKEEILAFIRRKEDTGALLITGEWGSGKSYFIKEVIAAEARESCKAVVAVVSLFGVDSVEALNHKVKEKYLDIRSGVATRVLRKVGRATKKVIESGMKIATTTNPGNLALAGAEKGISSVLSFNMLFDFMPVKNTVRVNKEDYKFVLVFDDMERCKINKVDLLGAINEYCENRKIKTVIIADEERITGAGKSERKIAVNEDEKTKTVTLTEESSADPYGEFKEKLIFQTLKFDADYGAIIDGIIANYAETVAGYKDFLKEKSATIKQVFNESRCKNIRTVKSVITNFERVYEAWKSSGVAMDNIGSVLYTFAADSFEKNANNFIKDDFGSYCFVKKGTASKYINYDSYSYRVNSLQVWIAEGKWDAEGFKKEIRDKFCPKTVSAYKKFLYWDLYTLDYETLKKGFEEALDSAYKGTLEGDGYGRLVQRYEFCTKNNIRLPCKVDFAKISATLDKKIAEIKGGKSQEEWRDFYVSEKTLNNAGANAKKIYEKLNYMARNFVAWKNRAGFLQAISKEKIGYYDFKPKYFECLDDELTKAFLEKYGKVDNAQKRVLGSFIEDGDFTLSYLTCGEQKAGIPQIDISITNFNKIISKLKAMNAIEKDAITKLVNGRFIDEFSDKAEWLEEHKKKILSMP